MKRRSLLFLAVAAIALGGGLGWAQFSLQITNFRCIEAGLYQIDGTATAGDRFVLQSSGGLGLPFIDLDGSLKVTSAEGMVSWLVDLGAATQGFYRIRRDVQKSLLTWADITNGLAGTFTVPYEWNGDDNPNFGYASGVHAQLTNGNLLVTGHPYHDRQAQLQLPATLDGREGTRVGNWIDITGGLTPTGWVEGVHERILVGGILQAADRIYFTKYVWYDGAATDWQSQGHYIGNLDGTGSAAGLWSVSNQYAHHSCVGGYLSEPPQVLRAAGYEYLAGQEGTSTGGGVGRWGPNLFAINPTVSNGQLQAATLICHPDIAHPAPDVRCSNATNAWWVANRPTNEVWWIANKVTDVKWIETETRQGILCFVYRGLGKMWYGEGYAGDGHSADPYWPDEKSYHAEGYALQVWIYDPADVMAVYRGERDPWSLTPVEAVLLTERLPGSATETHYSVFTGKAVADLKVSVRGNRLIVLQPDEYPADEWANMPKGYVFDLP